MLVVSFVVLVSGVYVYVFIPFWVDVILPRQESPSGRSITATTTGCHRDPEERGGNGETGKNIYPVEGFMVGNSVALLSCYGVANNEGERFGSFLVGPKNRKIVGKNTEVKCSNESDVWMV